MSLHTARSFERIIEYIDGIHDAARSLRAGDLNPDVAEQMLVDAMCLQASLTAYLMTCDLQRTAVKKG
jgi:hypothetical protein